MNYSCASCSYSCISYQKPPVQCPTQPNCCVSCERQLDPIFPANTNLRPQLKKPNPKCLPNKKQAPKCNNNNNRKKNCQKVNETCPDSIDCPNEDCPLKTAHPSDCACPKCEKCTGAEDSCAENNKQDISQGSSFCESEMANPCSERNMKNYMHDNPDLSDAKYKKSSTCADLIDCLRPNQEIWVLQCPKGFDPKTIVDTELGKVKKDKACKVDLTATKFKDKISLACLTCEKAAEYEAICDHIKMLKPVGKIIVTQTKNDVQEKSSNCSINIKSEICSDVENNDDCSDDVDVQNPIASKKIKKKFNDQKFTIETTVTVENCGDKKKNRKTKQESCGECLPLVPPEPVVPTKKQKKKKSCEDDDLSWLNC